jgi:hypothetical protein
MHNIYLCQSFMHSWEPTECLGIQILTIKLLLVISTVFVFFGRKTNYLAEERIARQNVV